ncbi:hypothetical protein OSB04_022644 [Centaurea solstitialis]|uniref:Cellulose synthase-like protein G3 n=1 Tax=Centaurea solstitialis TaxID=347529 RepID=A0AA38WIX0_9ASTR|nr:hypothetical protein OSB04_022644 [Centaurea solstitialis]
MVEPSLTTRTPSPIRWFNRVYALVSTIGICALFYRHLRNFLYTPSVTIFSLLLADVVLALVWATWQAGQVNPVHRRVFPEKLPLVVKEGGYPGLDVVVCTADPFKEPPIRVVNTVLSLMAYDYPTEKLSVYVSDDGGSQLTLFAFMEAAKFARFWLPYCRKYDILDRSPEVYFGNDSFLFPESYEIKVMYEGMKAKIEEVVEKRRVNHDQITMTVGLKLSANGRPHLHHKIIRQSLRSVLLESNEDKDIIGHPLPNLIYVSREKNKSVYHNFKGGALNTMIRVSASMTDSPIFLIQDCDMYSNNPKTPLYTLCHFLDPKVDPNLAFVQFPQSFHDINKVDTYGGQHLPEVRTNSWGMDGVRGMMFMGTGGFFKRQAFLGTPSSVGPSDISKAKTHRVEKKSIKSDDIMALAHRVAECRYEENTKWGLEMGFRYGTLIEDMYTGFRLQSQGWTSVFCDPERAAFLGNSPMSLSDILLQSKRWFVGFLEMIFSKHNPITYGFKHMNPILALIYAHFDFRPFWAIPIVIYAFLPQLALLNSRSIFPKVRKLLLSLPFAVIDWCEVVGLSTIEFNVTSKVLDDELRKRYEAGLFEFGVESPLFLTISIAAIVNLFAFLMGIVIVFKNGRFEELFAQLFVAGFGVVNSWPIYEAMVLRSDKGKMPVMITVKAIGVALGLCSIFSSAF